MNVSYAHVENQTFWLTIMDLACLVTGIVLGIALRFEPDRVVRELTLQPTGWLIFFTSVIVANHLAGAYRMQLTFSHFNLAVKWAFSMLFTMLILGVTTYAWFSQVLGRGVFLLAMLSYGTLSLSLRYIVYRFLFRRSVFVCRVAVLGGDMQRIAELRTILESKFVVPAHRVVAMFQVDEHNDHGFVGEKENGLERFDVAIRRLPELVADLKINLLVIGDRSYLNQERVRSHLRRIRFSGTEVFTPLNVAELYSGRTSLDEVDEENLWHASMFSHGPRIIRMKGIMDVSIALVGLVPALPVMALLAIAQKMLAPRWPVFYCQTRNGQFDRPFKIIKFRTMKPNAEKETGAVWASDKDPRVTRFGRFLRRTRLDELPQIFNVLMREMSLVGPRPERPEFVERLEARIPFYRERENVMPGLTGWAQVHFPYGSSEEDARRKLEYDLYYVKYQTLTLDLQILLSTVRIMLFGMERRH